MLKGSSKPPILTRTMPLQRPESQDRLKLTQTRELSIINDSHQSKHLQSAYSHELLPPNGA